MDPWFFYDGDEPEPLPLRDDDHVVDDVAVVYVVGLWLVLSACMVLHDVRDRWRRDASVLEHLSEVASATAEDAECCVCMEALAPLNGGVVALPCQHAMHRECARKWLRVNASCPVCRWAPPTLSSADDEAASFERVRFPFLSRDLQGVLV